MKKLIVGFLALFMLSIGTLEVPASAESISDVELTEEQQLEMSVLQRDAIEKKKEILNKYVEFGVFTEEKAQKIESHFEEMYSKLEQNGFIPEHEWFRHHKKENNQD